MASARASTCVRMFAKSPFREVIYTKSCLPKTSDIIQANAPIFFYFAEIQHLTDMRPINQFLGLKGTVQLGQNDLS